MFASRVTKSITIDGDDGEVPVVIQKLSARSLEKASDARQGAVAASSKRLGADMIRAFRETALAEKKAEAIDLEKARKERYAMYDREAVIQAGVKSWALDVSVAEAMPDLDEITVKTLHEAILDLSLPPIDPEELKAAQGKS